MPVPSLVAFYVPVTDLTSTNSCSTFQHCQSVTIMQVMEESWGSNVCKWGGHAAETQQRTPSCT